jgi:hypothetical protein
MFNSLICSWMFDRSSTFMTRLDSNPQSQYSSGRRQLCLRPRSLFSYSSAKLHKITYFLISSFLIWPINLYPAEGRIGQVLFPLLIFKSRLQTLVELTLQSPVVIICTTCFSILKLCILPSECTGMFPAVLTTNSDCFPKQHYLVAGLPRGDVMCFLWGTNSV